MVLSLQQKANASKRGNKIYLVKETEVARVIPVRDDNRDDFPRREQIRFRLRRERDWINQIDSVFRSQGGGIQISFEALVKAMPNREVS